jgi:hypothetical protein
MCIRKMAKSIFIHFEKYALSCSKSLTLVG